MKNEPQIKEILEKINATVSRIENRLFIAENKICRLEKHCAKYKKIVKELQNKIV